MRTTAGYSGIPNHALDNRLIHDSPLGILTLLDPNHLANAESMDIGIVSGERFPDALWLLLTDTRIDYLIYHKWDPSVPEWAPPVARLKELLREAKVFEDQDTLIYCAGR